MKMEYRVILCYQKRTNGGPLSAVMIHSYIGCGAGPYDTSFTTMMPPFSILG